MAMNNPYQKYQQNSITTATPEELTQMLFSGGVRFLHQSIKHIENSEMEQAHLALVRAQEIYIYLANTLNQQIEISSHLSRLYDFIVYQLTQANIKKDVALIKDVLSLAIDLRDTWQEAAQKAKMGE